ncbi:heavy metal tolerance protein [Phyllosticta citrichinensis]|uniref:Heavy metal tolerance protein n=1 Tax=Phyllosticta citrichinensis TaxID=1130410 RepID=A0ABR1XK53_9PEZI
MTSLGLTIVLWTYPVAFCLVALVANGYEVLHKPKEPAGKVDTRRIARADKTTFLLHIILVILLAVNTYIAGYGTLKGASGSLFVGEAYLGSMLSMLLIFCSTLLPDPDVPYTTARSNLQTWLLSAAYEAAILIMCLTRISTDQGGQSALVVTCEALSAARVVVLSLMSALFLLSRRRIDDTTSDEERESLLSEEQNVTHYGSSVAAAAADPRSKDAQTVSAFDYLAGFRDLLPYLWPSDSRLLQARAVFCFGLLAAQRIVNILVPHQLGVVVDHLGKGKLPLKEILIYVIYRGLQGQQGVIGSLRAILWIPISQSAYRRLTTAAFEHVMKLSLDFHLSKRIGEVISALSKGSAINTFLDGLIFQLFPMVFDLFIAALYFVFELDAFYAIIVVSVMWFYLFITIYMAKYRGRARREAANRDREMEAAKTDAIMSYETVHHNSALPVELSRFQHLVKRFQAAEYSVLFSLNMLNGVQNFIFVLSVLLVCLLAAYQISDGLHKVSMFVIVLTYLAQLSAPLNFFGSFYTQVQNNMVDAERMLALYKITPTVKDSPRAKPMPTCEGKIAFNHVNFAYDKRKPALADVSFEIAPGTTTAIVGESGSGKSTILKLLFRFYEIDGGSITVDGVDIHDATMETLRTHFGVVPQDTILFNESILYNLMYSKPDATFEEVQEACKVASIHDKILSFPDGYNTGVGERGLRLSGGEKQRIAIARAVLKRPQIMLLDEATASLDSQTERLIQDALKTACSGKTTIAIAHRLSTITESNQIIVMHSGSIVERGTHEELLALGGRYRSMWEKQTKTASSKSEGKKE